MTKSGPQEQVSLNSAGIRRFELLGSFVEVLGCWGFGLGPRIFTNSAA